MTAEGKMDGILCTAWDDCSPHFETYWRGFYDFAFFSWNNMNVSSDEVHSRFRQRFYAPAVADSTFEFEDLMEKTAAFWDTALVRSGSRQNYPEKIGLIDLPEARNNWGTVYKTRIERAQSALVECEKIKSRIAQTDRLAHANHYTLALMNRMNELLKYAPKLLILLDQFDRAGKSDKSKAKSAIREYVAGFGTIRSNYEQIFSETLFMAVSKEANSYPAGTP